MEWEAPPMEVELPNADLLQSAYQAVRPHLKPEDVPAAWRREGVSGTYMNVSGGQSPVATPILVPPPVVRMEPSLLHKKGLSRVQGPTTKRANLQKHTTVRGKASARLQGNLPKLPAPPGEQRHERVIQHRDRSTTYTLGGPRCSRTDGKHWQCKREALPEQKYCEKHLHRGLLRSRKRKVGDGHHDYEGDFLFRGWRKDKPKLELWPGLCDELSSPMDEIADTNGALLLSSPLHHPTLVGSTEPSAGPHGPPPDQWTAAQKQILKAAFSELGLDGQQLFPGRWGSRATLVDAPREKLAQPPMPRMLDSPYSSSRVAPQTLVAPHILRVGQDQAILPSTVQIIPGRDGNFMVNIPTASLTTVGISVKGDSLVSTWGPNVPIYLAVGGRSELVKVEAVRRDEDAVAFKGHVASEEFRPKAGAAVIPWDGPISVAASTDARATEGDLDLGLSLVAPSLDTKKVVTLPKSRPGLEGFLRDAGRHPLGNTGLVGKPEPQEEWEADGPYARPDWRANQSSILGKGTSPGLVKLEWPSPHSQCAPPLPTGFGVGATHQVYGSGTGDGDSHHADTVGGSFAGRDARPGEGMLAGMVASVILQTPRGVYFERGTQGEEMDMEGSTNERAVDVSRLPSVSGGQASQSGTREEEATDSASSPLKENRKRSPVGAFVNDTGSCDDSLDVALRRPRSETEKGREAEKTGRDQPLLGLGCSTVGPTVDENCPRFRAWQEQASALRARRGLDGSLTLATGRNLIGRSGTASPSSFSPWTAVRAMIVKNETAAIERRSRDDSVLPLKSSWGGSPGELLLGSPSLGSPDGCWVGSVRDAQGRT